MNSLHPEVAENLERERRQRRMRRVQVAMAVFSACIGLVMFSSVAGNPRFETYHRLDVVRLIIAGAGFGVALVLLIKSFTSPGLVAESKQE